MTGEPLSLVVLVSGRGSNLQAVLDRCADGSLDATVRAVISNRPEAPALERARRAGLVAEVVDHRAFADRSAFDVALAARVATHRPGLVVLAGFMRVLTAAFVDGFAGRLINIHPSLLPRHPGLDTHRRALEAGDREHGVSVHFVTAELDAGPVIAQARVPVLPDDDPDRLAARVLEAEHELLPRVIGWFAAGRVTLEDGTALLDGEPAPGA